MARMTGSSEQTKPVDEGLHCLTHGPTLAVALASFAVLLISARLLPRVPAALIVMALAAVAVKLLGLHTAGVNIIGPVPAGLPPFPEALVRKPWSRTAARRTHVSHVERRARCIPECG
jgi:MFS superfamily sulfate permease-like transporter